MPALKGFTLSVPEYYKNIELSSNGVIKALDNNYANFSAKKGNQTVSITVNRGNYYWWFRIIKNLFYTKIM